MIVTGGGARLAAVTVYSQRGFVEDLPPLGTGRQWHACGHFVNSENQPVSGDTDQCWRVRTVTLLAGVPGDRRLHRGQEAGLH